ncbi:hypothetical protein PG997_010721 [Apiospora hydei]|uniref:Uncharacterized protein n=1 Tax=Apiospora hydei TaxID=1337664 RepID=A0ABR1VKX4_9PEZI
MAQIIAMPEGFIGEALRVNQSSIEQTILSTNRPTVSHLNMSRTQVNVVVLFQALHRTQQHRLLTHRVAEDVAAALGHDSPAGANAVARIIDHYTAARLEFNRQNKAADKYHYRKHLHVLVDEEIRWRLTCGQNVQQVTPSISQHEAKRRYVGEMKQLISNSIKFLLEVGLPDLTNPHHSPRNDSFGKLKDVG